MTEETYGDVHFDIKQHPALNIGTGKIPEPMVNQLNEYCDELQDNENSKTYDSRLVGEIKKGKQLRVNEDEPRFWPFKKLLKDSANIYVQHFYQAAGKQPSPYHLEINDVWTVHQYESDYNPLHDHGSEYWSALSGFIHLKVPDQIKGKKIEQKDLHGAKGAMDGVTALHWGTTSGRDIPTFKYPQCDFIVPEPGVFYLFPIWLDHLVYPFVGEGERRTISWNINVVWDDDYIRNPIPSSVKLKTSVHERAKNV